MRFASLVLLPAIAVSAQAQNPTSKPSPKPVAKVAVKASPKETPESQSAKLMFQQVLDAVNGAWFGDPYRGVNAVEIQGSLGITLSTQALNNKVGEVTQGQIKGNLTKGGKAALNLKGTYFANGDFKTDATGDFGNLLYTRIGRRGFLYSKELNAYTTRIEPPPSDAPLTYFGWFRQTLNDIKAVYVDGSSFKASMGKEDTTDGQGLQTLIFNASTSAFDPKKREQSLDDTLDFWKKGRLELGYDKATKLPYHATFTNVAQGVNTQMNFVYSKERRLQSLTMTNQSKGMEGPGSLTVSYGGDGLITHLAGELSSQGKRVAFDLSLNWAKDKKSSSIVSVPPPGATKKGEGELKTLLLVGLAGEVLELQRNGLNLRSPSLTNK